MTSITLNPTFSLQFKKRIFVARVKNAHPFALSSTKQQKTSHFLSSPFFPPYFLPNQIDHYFPSIFVAYHFLSNCAIDRAKVLLVKAVLNYIPFNTKSYLKTKILSLSTPVKGHWDVAYHFLSNCAIDRAKILFS